MVEIYNTSNFLIALPCLGQATLCYLNCVCNLKIQRVCKPLNSYQVNILLVCIHLQTNIL